MDTPMASDISDLDDDGSSQEFAGRISTLPGVAFEHFKVSHDPAWDYEKICKEMFREDEKYLCVLEKVATNPHAHFQGIPRDDQKTQDRKRKALAETHYRKKIERCNPVKKMKRGADEVGFQYINKTVVGPQYILARNGFTDEELKDLHEKSKAHVSKLKYTVTDWILDLPDEKIVKLWKAGHEDVNRLLREITTLLFEAADRGEIEIPKYNRKYSRDSVINGLTNNKKLPTRLRAALFVHP